MAKKSKSSKKSKDDASMKSKATATTEKKSEIEAVKTKPEETTIKTETVKKESCVKGFFAKKYEEKESILTVFKQPKFYGALLGEVIGTMFLTLLFFSIFLLNIPTLATYAFVIIAILIGIYAFSGACLNPLITVGMMATRRVSVIRGIMYIIAEIIGAWLAWLIFNGFRLAGGETAYNLEVPVMTATPEGKFLALALIEMLGSFVIAFFFARALKYKRSVFTFGTVIAGGIILGVLIAYICSAFIGIVGENTFVMNPAIAMMMQIFPTSGNDFGEIMGGIAQALSLYMLLPMVAGVIGFYLSDFTSKLSGEE